MFVSDNEWLTIETRRNYWDNLTPALSHDQVLKKDTNKRLLYSGPNWHTDTGKYCQNLKTLGNSDF